nr:hypothetical protein [uncultured Methanoregula sp.]
MNTEKLNEILYSPFKYILNYMIPAFNEYGNIPVGEHEASLPEFKIRFVSEFNSSSTRNDLYTNYINYNVLLSTFNVAKKERVVGSYTSAKVDPTDVDLIVYIDALLLIQCHEEHNLWNNLNEDMIHDTYKCHTFLVFIYPEDDPRYEHALHVREHWEKWFSKDRSDRPRGAISLDLISTQYRSDLRVEGGV